jgi:hypothetical protein
MHSEVKGKKVHKNYIIVLPNNKLITLKILRQNITVPNSAIQKTTMHSRIINASVAGGYKTSKVTRFYLLLRHQR